MILNPMLKTIQPTFMMAATSFLISERSFVNLHIYRNQ